MFVTIWMCTHEWSLISIRTTALTFATCHQPLSCLSSLTRSRSVRSLRLPRTGTLIRICSTACAGVRRVSRSRLRRDRLVDPLLGLLVQRHALKLYGWRARRAELGRRRRQRFRGRRARRQLEVRRRQRRRSERDRHAVRDERAEPHVEEVRQRREDEPGSARWRSRSRMNVIRIEAEDVPAVPAHDLARARERLAGRRPFDHDHGHDHRPDREEDRGPATMSRTRPIADPDRREDPGDDERGSRGRTAAYVSPIVRSARPSRTSRTSSTSAPCTQK